MTNNDILRRLRYIFDFNDDKMINVFELGGYKTNRSRVSDWLKKEDHENFAELKDIHLAIFLNGIIILNRGKKDGKTPEPEKRLNNNIIFRKLKIALSFKDDDIMEMFRLADLIVSKHEISAIFRKPGQRQYRICKDQFLRNFLIGLQIKYRGRKKRDIRNK